MKKTLLVISLALAAASSQSYAWTNGSVGGSFVMGGTLTPQQAPVMVWAAKLGAASNLDASSIPLNTKSVTIPVTADIPLLGFRTSTTGGLFTSVTGSTNNPTIDYGGKLDLASINNGVGTLTLDVHDATNTKIGTLEAKLATAGIASQVTGATATAVSLYAKDKTAADAFSGGLAVDAGKAIAKSADAEAMISKFFPDVTFDDQSGTAGAAAALVDFNDTAVTSFSGAYAAGINSGDDLSVSLDAALSADTEWKATLPITITYG